MSTTLSREYLAESRQASLYAAETITYFGALVAVELRFWSRRMKAAGFWIDDWLIVAAMVCATAMLANIYWWISRGYGKHLEASGPKADYNFFLGFFMAEIIYTFIITIVKYSILALYWRVFGRDAIRWPVWILTAIVTAWGIAVLFLSIFTCVPPKAFWDKSVVNANCGVNNKKFLWGISIPNILTDVTLLLIPIPYILRLNTQWSQKRLLLGTFFLGGFVCIASIMRLISVVHQNQGPDASWHWVNQGIWAVIESNLAIISACLPALRPIWTRVFKTSSRKANSPSEGRFPMWALGSSPSSKRSRKKTPDESLLNTTMNSSIHPFAAITDSNEGAHECISAPNPTAYTKRAALEGYEVENGGGNNCTA